MTGDPPEIQVLLLRADWTKGAALFDWPHEWRTVNLLEVPHYMNIGFLAVAFDPVAEQAYRAWREGAA